jgi:metal-responsive CopG/Arc/MetJ family transcriptional regulator
MAKVMVSMPAELLAEVDAEARRLGTSRSAVLRGFAEAAVRRRRGDRAEAMREVLRNHASDYGGNSAEQVKATRPGP